MRRKRRFRDNGKINGGIGEVISYAVLIMPFDFFFFLFIRQRHSQSRAKHRFGSQRMTEFRDRKIGRIEIGRVGLEANTGAGISFAATSSHRQVSRLIPAREGHGMHIAVSTNGDLKPLRQGVYH